MTKFNLPIEALQEVRWPGKGNVMTGNHTIFYGRTENNRYENSGGFLINDSILPNLQQSTRDYALFK